MLGGHIDIRSCICELARLSLLLSSANLVQRLKAWSLPQEAVQRASRCWLVVIGELPSWEIEIDLGVPYVLLGAYACSLVCRLIPRQTCM